MQKCRPDERVTGARMEISTFYVLSLVGRGFFSSVSVFFNLVLSNVVTADTSGLSAISIALENGSRHKNRTLAEAARACGK